MLPANPSNGFQGIVFTPFLTAFWSGMNPTKPSFCRIVYASPFVTAFLKICSVSPAHSPLLGNAVAIVVATCSASEAAVCIAISSLPGVIGTSLSISLSGKG